MKFCKVSERGATIATQSHWSARKRPAGHTAGLFLSLNREYFANSSPEVKQRRKLYPTVIPQNGITSPKL